MPDHALAEALAYAQEITSDDGEITVHRRHWFIAEHDDTPGCWCEPIVLKAQEPLDIAEIERQVNACSRIGWVKRHEVQVQEV